MVVAASRGRSHPPVYAYNAIAENSCSGAESLHFADRVSMYAGRGSRPWT
jgi:hypothetical protein